MPSFSRVVALGLAVVIAGAACAPAGADKIASFISVTGAPTRSVQINLAGTASSSGSQATVRGSYDVEGADFRGAIAFATGEFDETEVETVVVGDRAWIKSFDQTWHSPPTMPSTPDPFAGLTAGGVEYAGAIERDGRSLHALRILDPVPAVERLLGPALQGTQVRLELIGASFEVLVDDAGTPVTASLTMEATGAACPPGADCDDEATESLAMSIGYTFADWGRDFEIEPPVE